MEIRLLIMVVICFFLSCDKGPEYPFDLPWTNEIDCDDHRIVSRGLFYEDEDGNEFLWGGEEEETHFEVNDMTLSPCNLYYGLGREHFSALIETQYEPLSDVVDNFDDIEKTLILRSGGIVKVYPYSILVKHELVNDVVGGHPVMIVHCFLADLTAVYSRRYCGKELTFGVSGYTYLDEDISGGLESFVLWDRDSESLWWPITEKGVSGIFRGEDMKRYDESKWQDMRWGNVKENYPNAVVLKDNQTMEVPSDWPPIYSDELQCF